MCTVTHHFQEIKRVKDLSVSYGATFQTAGDIVGVALDMDARNTYWFFKNGVHFSGASI
jgi:hypothetical protein